jgi:hypothetical protein
MAESLRRLVSLTSSCLRLVEAELGRAGSRTGQPGIEDALERVQRLRPAVELIGLIAGRDDEGEDDGRDD